MDVAGILRSAKEAVENAEIPEDLRVLAFGKAVDLLTAPIVPAQRSDTSARQSSTETPTSENGAEASAGVTGAVVGDGQLSKLASQLKLDAELVSELFHILNDDVQLTFPPSKLPKNNKKLATQQIALLYAAGRQGLGLEEFTSTDSIRKIVEDYGQLDSGNFAAHVKAMDDRVQLQQDGSKRLVKLKRTGWEAATELVRSLGGGDS